MKMLGDLERPDHGRMWQGRQAAVPRARVSAARHTRQGDWLWLVAVALALSFWMMLIAVAAP